MYNRYLETSRLSLSSSCQTSLNYVLGTQEHLEQKNLIASWLVTPTATRYSLRPINSFLSFSLFYSFHKEHIKLLKMFSSVSQGFIISIIRVAIGDGSTGRMRGRRACAWAHLRPQLARARAERNVEPLRKTVKRTKVLFLIRSK